VAIFRGSRANSHWNELMPGAVGPRQAQITRAHVVFDDIQEKDLPELLFSLVVAQQLIRSGSGSNNQSMIVLNSCPMQ
jgi:hypothetical protein